jgi:hypothetical protein
MPSSNWRMNMLPIAISSAIPATANQSLRRPTTLTPSSPR